MFVLPSHSHIWCVNFHIANLCGFLSTRPFITPGDTSRVLRNSLHAFHAAQDGGPCLGHFSVLALPLLE